MQTTCPTKIVISHLEQDLAPSHILALEMYLNDIVAGAVWMKLGLGVRFHISMPIQFVEKTKEG